MNPYPFQVKQQMQQFYHSLSEKDRRRYALTHAMDRHDVARDRTSPDLSTLLQVLAES